MGPAGWLMFALYSQGTKRSRPPPEMDWSTRGKEVSDNEPLTSVLNGSTHTIRSAFNVVGSIAIPEGEESSSKRRKTPPARPLSKAHEMDDASGPKAIIRPAEIIEPADDTAHVNGKPAPSPPAVTLSPPSVTKPLFGIVKTSAPKEPSKLRYSFHADKVEVKSTDAIPAPSFSSFFAPPPVPSPALAMTMVAPVKAKLSSKEEALAMSVDQLPKYTFAFAVTSSPAGPSSFAARNAALSLAVTSLPTYEFATAIVPVRAMNGFNWTAAGLKAPTIPAQTWMCSLCGLQNPAGAKEKCTICDAPRQPPTDSSPSSASAPAPTFSTPTATAPPTAPVKSFDWSAAGLAPPKLQSGTWTCSVCSLSNPASATDKCSICDSPR